MMSVNLLRVHAVNDQAKLIGDSFRLYRAVENYSPFKSRVAHRADEVFKALPWVSVFVQGPSIGRLENRTVSVALLIAVHKLQYAVAGMLPLKQKRGFRRARASPAGFGLRTRPIDRLLNNQVEHVRLNTALINEQGFARRANILRLRVIDEYILLAQYAVKAFAVP